MKVKGFAPLDKEEAEIMRAIERDELVPIKNKKAEIKRLVSYFQQMPRKDKRVTIRVNDNDLQKIQNKAVRSGIPYQTLISALIRQFAEGKISLQF